MAMSELELGLHFVFGVLLLIFAVPMIKVNLVIGTVMLGIGVSLLEISKCMRGGKADLKSSTLVMVRG